MIWKLTSIDRGLQVPTMLIAKDKPHHLCLQPPPGSPFVLENISHSTVHLYIPTQHQSYVLRMVMCSLALWIEILRHQLPGERRKHVYQRSRREVRGLAYIRDVKRGSDACYLP